jgi:hypothetical protein
MESNGIRNRIQVSERRQIYSLLEGHWVTKRDEEVSARAKARCRPLGGPKNGAGGSVTSSFSQHTEMIRGLSIIDDKTSAS